MGSSVLSFPRPALIVALCLALTLSACKTGREDDIGPSAPEQIYDRAYRSVSSGDFNNAIRLYEALEARFPFSEEARQGRLDILYAYYKARQTESAIDAADQFIRENPTHPRVDYAWYIKGLVNFERNPNLVERWFRADLTERPPQEARASFQAFQTLVERYPNSLYANDARQRMIFLRNRLADYEVHVADYYLRRRAYVAAASRAKFCIENYDGAPAVREAVDVLASSYDGMGLEDLASEVRSVYAFNYGDTRPRREQSDPWWKVW